MWELVKGCDGYGDRSEDGEWRGMVMFVRVSLGEWEWEGVVGIEKITFGRGEGGVDKTYCSRCSNLAHVYQSLVQSGCSG